MTVSYKTYSVQKNDAPNNLSSQRAYEATLKIND